MHVERQPSQGVESFGRRPGCLSETASVAPKSGWYAPAYWSQKVAVHFTAFQQLTLAALLILIHSVVFRCRISWRSYEAVDGKNGQRDCFISASFSHSKRHDGSGQMNSFTSKFHNIYLEKRCVPFYGNRMLDYLPASSHSVETACAFGAIMGARPLAQRLELPGPAKTDTRESFLAASCHGARARMSRSIYRVRRSFFYLSVCFKYLHCMSTEYTNLMCYTHARRAVGAAGQDVIERPVTRLAAAAASGRHRQTRAHTVQKNPLHHHQGKQKKT